MYNAHAQKSRACTDVNESPHKLSLHLIIENCPKDHFHREQIRVYVKGKSKKKISCIYKSVYSATLANDWRN